MTFSGGSRAKEEGFFSILLSKALYPNGIKCDECRSLNMGTVALCFIMLLPLLSRFSHVRLCATPQTEAYQAPPSLGFSRQEHWSGLPFPSPMQ